MCLTSAQGQWQRRLACPGCRSDGLHKQQLLLSSKQRAQPRLRPTIVKWCRFKSKTSEKVISIRAPIMYVSLFFRKTTVVLEGSPVQCWSVIYPLPISIISYLQNVYFQLLTHFIETHAFTGYLEILGHDNTMVIHFLACPQSFQQRP